jgi:hypothetical protein
VEAEAFALCHTEAIDDMGMACGHLMIQPLVDLRFPEAPCSVQCSEQAVVGFHGVEAVAESLAVGEGFVGSKRIDCMGAIDEARGSTSP